MKPEYEARFPGIDAAALVEELNTRGAVCKISRTLMKRVIFENDYIHGKRGWLRLREEGDVTMLTYKQATGNTSAVDSVHEVQTAVASFDAAKQLLEAVGFAAVRYQENYREEWELDGITYDFDTWPDLPTFLEIEGPDEETVKTAAKALDLNFDEAVFGSVDELYVSALSRDILSESRLVFQ